MLQVRQLHKAGEKVDLLEAHWSPEVPGLIEGWVQWVSKVLCFSWFNFVSFLLFPPVHPGWQPTSPPNNWTSDDHSGGIWKIWSGFHHHPWPGHRRHVPRYVWNDCSSGNLQPAGEHFFLHRFHIIRSLYSKLFWNRQQALVHVTVETLRAKATSLATKVKDQDECSLCAILNWMQPTKNGNTAHHSLLFHASNLLSASPALTAAGHLSAGAAVNQLHGNFRQQGVRERSAIACGVLRRPAASTFSRLKNWERQVHGCKDLTVRYDGKELPISGDSLSSVMLPSSSNQKTNAHKQNFKEE